VSDDLLRYGVHKTHEASVLVKVRGVIDDVRMSRVGNVLLRELREPIVFDPCEFGGAVA